MDTAERDKSSVDVQPYRCLFTHLRPLHGGNIPAAIALAAKSPCLIFVYVCTVRSVRSKPKSEVVFGSVEVKP